VKTEPPSPEQTGLVWWRSLSPEQKKAVIQPLIEVYGMSNLEISNYLELDSIGRVASIRHKLKLEKLAGMPIPQVVHSVEEPTITAATLKEAFNNLEPNQQAALIEARLHGRWKPPQQLRPLFWRQKHEQDQIKRQAAVLLIDWR